MKILYFSGTGNSYDVAVRLGGEQIDVCSATENEVSDEVVGIVFPVYCNDIPNVLAEFLQRVHIKAQYVFAVATAGASAGNSFAHIDGLLQKNGSKLSYTHTIVMPDSCIIFKTPLEKQPALMAAVQGETDKIKVQIENRAITEIKTKSCPTKATKVMWWFMHNALGIKHKTSDTQKCILCKKCLSCPMGNIGEKDGKIVFLNKCEDCFRCIQICPTEAIRFGRVKRTESSRYLNERWLKDHNRQKE